MNFQYQIYGLRIASSREIKLLSPLKVDFVDLEVVWTTSGAETPDRRLGWERVMTRELMQRRGISLWSAETTEGIYTKLRYETEISHIDFLLDPPRKKMWILHDRNEIESDLDSYFVGPVLGCALRLRGVACLHASVVEIDEKAVVFLGHKHSGKSTTAAGFSKLGYKILADDIAVITPDGDGFRVQSGYPKIRLRPEPLAALAEGVAANSLPIVYTTRPSRYWDLRESGGFREKSLPLGAVYLLGTIENGDPTPFVKRLSPQEKMLKLTENTFGSYVITSELRKKEFMFLSKLAKTVLIRELMYGHELETLSRQCLTVVEDFRREKAEQ